MPHHSASTATLGTFLHWYTLLLPPPLALVLACTSTLTLAAAASLSVAGERMRAAAPPALPLLAATASEGRGV